LLFFEEVISLEISKPYYGILKFFNTLIFYGYF